MLTFIVRMRFESADHEDVAESLRLLTAASRQEPGCVSYIAHFVEDDPNLVLIYEQYRDKTALQEHRNTAHFRDHAVGGLYQKMRERHIENLVAVS